MIIPQFSDQNSHLAMANVENIFFLKMCMMPILFFNKFAIKTSITPFGATNGASEIVSLACEKLRRGTSN